MTIFDYKDKPFFKVYTSSDMTLLSNIMNLDTGYKVCSFNGNKDTTGYYPLGNIIIRDSSKFTILLVLADNRISKSPIDYEKVYTYNNMNFWKPIVPKGYKYMGLVASIKKPSVYEIRVVKKEYIKEITNNSKLFIQPMNKYNMLNIKTLKSYSIIDDDTSNYSESWGDTETEKEDILDNYHYENAVLSTNYTPWFKNNNKKMLGSDNNNRSMAFPSLIVIIMIVIFLYIRRIIIC